MVTMFNPPADVSAALAQARELLDSNPARAAERSRQVLASSPHNADAYRLLGAALRRLGQDPAANDAELAAIEASGNDPELAAAGEAMLKQDYMSAEQILRGILQRRPEDVAAMRMLGEIAANFGALRDAERQENRYHGCRRYSDDPTFAPVSHVASSLSRSRIPRRAVLVVERRGKLYAGIVLMSMMGGKANMSGAESIVDTIPSKSLQTDQPFHLPNETTPEGCS